MKQYNVLVFPGGTEIGLEIHRALCQCKNVHLFSVGLDISNHAPYIFEHHYCIPSIYEENWVDEINKIITKHKIDYIFPAYDDIIVALVQNADKIKARIISSPLETCLITRSKSETYRFFNGILPVPKLYTSIEEINEYPVFVKPDKGQGSQGTQIVDSKNEILNILRDRKDKIILEYLPGEEYTIDCFSDRDLGLLYCGGRQRIRVKSGISMDSRPVYDDAFFEFANIISKYLKLYGAWFFQLKRDRNGDCKLLEIAPRIAGTMALHRVLGVNFPLLSIYEQERIPVEIRPNDINVEVDRALINRYKHDLQYNTVYIDLDDTLVLNNKINTDLIKFLYQCINTGKQIILVTKHNADVHQTLKKYRLSEVFHEIIHLDRLENKSGYLKGKKAIFIDDSFNERKIVNQDLGIPTFDCSMIEMLIDERA